MYISTEDWKNYIEKLSTLDKKAGELMKEWIRKHGFADTDALIEYAYAVASKYGEGSAALSAEMYDQIADLQGKFYEPAIPAPTPKKDEIAKTINGIMKTSQNINSYANAVSRLVKRTGADTTLRNAERDGAEFAWIPNGDTCAFCIALASRGWQRISRKSYSHGHAEHIHANCDCEYAIRFDGKSGVAGYDPDKYLEMYESADGKNPNDKINSIRRMKYQENKDRINAQKRMAYANRQERLKNSSESGKLETRKDSGDYLVSKNEFVDSIEKDPKLFGNNTPEELKTELENMGYEVKPLSGGVFRNIPFEEGGGYKINYDGDKILSYHPKEHSHHREAYYKLSDGKKGIRRYDLNGEEIFI